ncbi:MAG: glycoside hydrolase family 2 [Myxococcota bacterium]|nr:glycoside hydrolase family 2 [Myxococcota bacterium]
MRIADSLVPGNRPGSFSVSFLFVVASSVAIAIGCGGGGGGQGQTAGSSGNSAGIGSGSAVGSGSTAFDASVQDDASQSPTGSGGSGAPVGGGSGSQGGSGSAPGADGGGSGAGSSGNSTVGNPPAADPNRVRTLLSMDKGWLFFKGDATGADQGSFADMSWRVLDVPHDWSIEGPFDMNAPTTGRGGYLPAGVGWYRKHFTIPQNLSNRQVFIEFDGVMANSDVYINGFHLGKRPYGYMSFRYDMTGHVMFGSTDNVISVRCDNSVQPASRWYAGAGIYRHVRLLAADPVHVDQWATYVTTPMATSAAATVHVTTAVVNTGTAAQSVALQGIVSDPSGTALPPVTAPAQSIAAGATASFAFDVPVSNPKLWDVASPNMYRLLLNVQVGGATLDDDVTSFGIRTLTFDAATGMSLNGKSVKLKGVAMHHDVSALGAAVPMRAWQRRLAQFKSFGVNAIRTAHNPVAPEVLDLADRMGLLVLDEFFDAWVSHKYADVGDYGAYFNTWYQIDVADIVKRDRNHPSVALYSLGNEIRDSVSTRAPLATKMVSICHQLDPGRAVTQALFDPQQAGDVTGATRTIVDVFGANYQVASIIQAMGMSPARAGLITEIGHATSTWSTVTSTPGLAGMFLWTGVDYLGEAPNGWPNVGSGAGLMDRVGTLRADAYAYQKLWGAPSTSPPATGTSASKVVLTADHPTIMVDGNDISYVKATIADGSGNVVTGASNAVTFSVTGPGAIVAVDSGTLVGESFRGTQRNAFQGVCFALVQATGPGAITVTASAAGLTGSSATVQSTAGRFVPCSGACD